MEGRLLSSSKLPPAVLLFCFAFLQGFDVGMHSYFLSRLSPQAYETFSKRKRMSPVIQHLYFIKGFKRKLSVLSLPWLAQNIFQKADFLSAERFINFILRCQVWSLGGCKCAVIKWNEWFLTCSSCMGDFRSVWGEMLPISAAMKRDAFFFIRKFIPLEERLISC